MLPANLLQGIRKQYAFMLNTFGVPAKLDPAATPGQLQDIIIAISTSPSSGDNPVVGSSDTASATFTSATKFAEQDRVRVNGTVYTLTSVKVVTVNQIPIAYKATALERIR